MLLHPLTTLPCGDTFLHKLRGTSAPCVPTGGSRTFGCVLNQSKDVQLALTFLLVQQGAGAPFVVSAVMHVRRRPGRQYTQ